MRRSTLHHLVIVSPTLPLGSQFVERQLGVRLQADGEHPRMSTHNLLLRLGESLYLEVIAPDSKAPLPTRARWLGLDGLSEQASPYLAHWVARTEHLDTADGARRDVVGEIEPMSREALSWKITIQPDGHLPLNGAVPSLIDWGESEHPAQSLGDQGCELEYLESALPDPRLLERQLESIGFIGAVSVLRSERHALKAYINTPNGLSHPVTSNLSFADFMAGQNWAACDEEILSLNVRHGSFAVTRARPLSTGTGLFAKRQPPFLA